MFGYVTVRSIGSQADTEVMATTSSVYQETTKGGSIRNVQTDVSKADFIKNLQDSGYKTTKQETLRF